MRIKATTWARMSSLQVLSGEMIYEQEPDELIISSDVLTVV